MSSFGDARELAEFVPFPTFLPSDPTGLEQKLQDLETLSQDQAIGPVEMAAVPAG